MQMVQRTSVVLGLILAVAFALTVMACNSSLVQGGACYDSYGKKVTHVWDASGKKWAVKKVDANLLGSDLAFCGVDRKAATYIDRNREVISFSSFYEPRYLTDETGEKKYALEGRREGSYYFAMVGRYSLEWY